jgi:organic hydroperoxide reductase OsmC/OhrA
MQDLPHHYVVAAAAAGTGDVETRADGLPTMRVSSPVEFGGRGDRWSPETLLVAAVADCFVLTFRAVAHASRVSWLSLECHVTGTLDRVERGMQFTEFDVRAHLRIAAECDPEAARRALEKTDRNCLIVNSLKAKVHLTASITGGSVACEDEPCFALES